MNNPFKSGSIDTSGWDWNKFPFRPDPMTQRKICRDCWDGEHAPSENSEHGFTICKLSGCSCACRESIANQQAENKLSSAARRNARKLRREALESSPLAALNEAFKPKTRKRIHA